MRRFYSLFQIFITLIAAAPLSAQCPITVDAGEDIYLCSPPSPTQLNGSIDGDYLSFTWSPTTGLIGANTLSPSVNVTQTTKYTLTARAADLSNNLIVNGDFESGNSGFYSEYIESPGNLWPEGVYEVLTNPQSSHPNFSPCMDHTSGTGNMMAVNGAGIANVNVWCQTVTVMPNTQYVFSAWVTSLVAASPAQLQFSINGGIIGPIFTPGPTTCKWSNFYTTWNSGAASSATICIVNQNTALSGNDFALDDIVFSPICQVSDTVTVHVVTIQAAASPALSVLPCAGAHVTLSGVGSSTGPDITYNWDTQNGNIVSGQNTLSPVVDAAGTYTLTVTFDNGFVECTKTASVNVIESPNPLAAWVTPPNPIGCGSTTAILHANSTQPGFSTYQWTAGPGGNIVTGTNSQNATVDQPGEYTLLVTNTSTGCTAEASVTVLSATNPPTAVAAAADTISCILPQVGLSGAGSSTGANITYGWSTLAGGNLVMGQNAQNAVVNGGGTYVLTVTNTSNGCTAVDTVVVYSNTTPPAISFATPGVINCLTDTLSLSATVTPNVPNPVWTAFNGGNLAGGQNTLTPQVNAPGSYTLSVTNPANGCTAADTIAVGANLTPPNATILPADTITCQHPSVTLSGAGSSAGANFTYNWTANPGGNIVSGDSTLNPVVNAASTYYLLVTNTVNGCTAADTVAVLSDANAIVAVANAPDTLTCTDTTVLLNANGSSNLGGLTYSWSTSNGVIETGGDTPTPTVSATGTYLLVLTNPANGCTATDQAVVIENIAPPVLLISAPDTLTCANPSQTLHGQNTAPGAQFSYTWTASNGGNLLTGDSTLSPVVNAAGTYTLTATNLVNGCSSTASTAVAIETGTPVAVAAMPGPITCTDPTQTINTSGSSSGPNFSFVWSTGNGGNILNGGNGPTPMVDAPGTYALTVTNLNNGCTATVTVTVTEDTVYPPADAGPDGLLTCTSPTFSLSANTGLPTAGLVFAWQTPNGQFTGNPDSALVDCNQSGTYILTVVNPQNGCTTLDTTVVTANQVPPAVSILPAPQLNCTVLTATLNTSGGNSNMIYQWQTTSGQFISGQTGSAPVVNAPGAYDLVVTDTVNGCTTTASATVLQDIATPNAGAGASPTLTCTVKQAVLQGTASTGPNFTQAWTSSNGGNIVSGGNTPTPTVDQPGNYTLLVTNTDNGCTNTAAVAVLQNITAPTVNAGPDDTLSCAVSSLTLQASGGASGTPVYSWSAGNGGNIVSGKNTLAPVINAPGMYTLLVTDLINGCTATDFVQILNDDSAPSASVATPGTLTCVVKQLTLQGFGSVGANFTHNWTANGGGNIVSGANTLSPVVNAPGMYVLTITNQNNGCTATAQSTVNQNITPPAAGIAPPGILTCAVKSVPLAASPTGANFAFTWQTPNGQIVSGGATPSPVVSRPGTYNVVVTNTVNGCTDAASVQVGIDTLAPAIAAATPQTITCVLKQIPLAGTVSQPVAGFVASWTTTNGHFVGGQNSLSPTVDKAGNYLLTVQNQQNGCTSTTTVAVPQNIVPPLADAGPAPTITCAQPLVQLDGSTSSGQGALGFAWSGGAISSGGGTPQPGVTAAATYTLVVTDNANGCTASDAVTVLENTTPPNAVIAPPLPLTCVRKLVTLDAGTSSAGPNFTPTWTTTNGHFASGQQSLSPQVDAPGVYVLTIQNQLNGCTTTVNAAVGTDLTPPDADAGPAAVLHCKQPEATLTGSSNTAGVLNYAWSAGSGGHIVSGLNTANPVVDAPGAYQMTVTDADNGCTAVDGTTVTEVPLPAFIPTLQQPDCHTSKGSIAFGPVTGGAAPFRYSRDGGLQYQSAPDFANLAPGTYLLVVEDNYGCTATATADIATPFFPTVGLPVSVLVELGDSVLLEPVLNLPYDQVADWLWTPSDGLSCNDCPTPWARPLKPTTYHLNILDQNGCPAAADVLVRVNRRRQLYAPNIISPNGDGKNDRFLLYGRGVVEIETLRIFDRWGDQLFLNEHFQPNDESMGWDGSFRGQPMNPGVYVWQAVVKFIDGVTETFAGDVTVYR